MPILNLAAWPTAEDLELDNSQYKALQMALTKEFAVIQGPPGTGKTYLGLKVRRQKLKSSEHYFSVIMPATITSKFYGFSDSVYELLVRIINTNHQISQLQREEKLCNHC